MSPEFKFIHPDSCVVIRDADLTMTYRHDEGLAIFSNEANAQAFVIKKELGIVSLQTITWNELVEMYGNNFSSCILDHKGEDGFYDELLIK